MMDASGGDVLFTTADPLIPSDVDSGQRDVYDARVGGGFPLVPGGESGVCSAGSCEGPVSSPAVVPPGSVSNTGEAPVVTPPAKKTAVKKKTVKHKAVKKKSKKKAGKKKVKSKGKDLISGRGLRDGVGVADGVVVGLGGGV